MEGVYLILITTTNSNIVEDLETLHHLCKTVKDICEVVSEKEVYDNFDSILFAIDEMILPSEDLGGFSEGLTPHQIFTLLEMESVEENLQDIIKQQREAEAKQEAKRKAFEIAQRKAQNVVENLSKGLKTLFLKNHKGNPTFFFFSHQEWHKINQELAIWVTHLLISLVLLERNVLFFFPFPF